MWDETVSKVCGLHHSLWPTPLINFLPKGIMSLQYYDWHFGYSNLKFGLKAKHSWQTTFVFPPNANVNIHNHVHQNFLVSRSGKVPTWRSHEWKLAVVHWRQIDCIRQASSSKWVGKAWQEVNQSKDSIIRSFKKSRISLDLSGSEDDDINIEGIPYYKMQSADEDLVEFHLESDDSDDDVYDNNEDHELEAGHTTR